MILGIFMMASFMIILIIICIDDLAKNKMVYGENQGMYLILFLWMILIVTFTFASTKDIYDKKGQIKVLTGNAEYKLITNSDSTRVWEKKEDKK